MQTKVVGKRPTMPRSARHYRTRDRATAIVGTVDWDSLRDFVRRHPWETALIVVLSWSARSTNLGNVRSADAVRQGCPGHAAIRALIEVSHSAAFPQLRFTGSAESSALVRAACGTVV